MKTHYQPADSISFVFWVFYQVKRRYRVLKLLLEPWVLHFSCGYIYGWYLYQKKKNETDQVQKTLNSYNQNIKLQVELNPTKFLETAKLQIMGTLKLKSSSYIDRQKPQRDKNIMSLYVSYVEQRKLPLIFTLKLNILLEKL